MTVGLLTPVRIFVIRGLKGWGHCLQLSYTVQSWEIYRIQIKFLYPTIMQLFLIFCLLYLFNCIFSTFYDCSDHFSRWLRSSVVLSLPGLVFSVLFTLPNYFQLRTIIKTDVITKLDNKTHSQLIEVWLDLLLTVFASYFFQLLRDVYPFGRLNSSEKPNSYQFQEIEEDSKYNIQKQELTYLST